MKSTMQHKLFVGAAAALLLLGGVGGATALASNSRLSSQQPTGNVAAPVETKMEVQAPKYTGSIPVAEQGAELSEAEEAAQLQSLAKIGAADAEAAALAAHPGAQVVKSELDNENGSLVYSVELNNGLDVKVDAGTGAILFVENGEDDEETSAAEDQAELEEADDSQEGREAADHDDVQEEHDGQPDDHAETPGVEDTAG